MITLLDIRLDVYQPDMRLKKKLVSLKLVCDSVIEVLIRNKNQRTSLNALKLIFEISSHQNQLSGSFRGYSSIY